jgi:hypothetical protein
VVIVVVLKDTTKADGNIAAGGTEVAVTEKIAKDKDVDPGLPEMNR